MTEEVAEGWKVVGASSVQGPEDALLWRETVVCRESALNHGRVTINQLPDS